MKPRRYRTHSHSVSSSSYCSDGGACVEVAQALQAKLDTYKQDKRDLGSVSFFRIPR